jgi:hypothetical protein
MEKQDEGIEVIIGAGKDVNFHTLEECDAWIKRHRELHPHDPIHIRVRFSPEASFRNISYNKLIDHWDLVKDNLSMTIESASIFPKNRIVVPKNVLLKDCDLWGTDASRKFTYFRPVVDHPAPWVHLPPVKKSVWAVRMTLVR